MSRFMVDVARVHLDVPSLLASLSFPSNAYLQLPVGWTLKIEMIFSLLLPAMVLIARRSHWTVLIAISLLAFWLPERWRDYWYASEFAAGIVIFLGGHRLGAPSTRLPWPATAFGFVAALCFLDTPFLLGWATPGAGVIIAGRDRASIAVMGLGAAGMLLAALHVKWVASAFASRPCVWLGKVSYSLYLLHMTAFIGCTFLVKPRATLFDGVFLGILVVAVSCTIAAVSYRWVERPCIHAANAVCTWLSTKTHTTPVPTGDVTES